MSKEYHGIFTELLGTSIPHTSILLKPQNLQPILVYVNDVHKEASRLP